MFSQHKIIMPSQITLKRIDKFVGEVKAEIEKEQRNILVDMKDVEEFHPAFLGWVILLAEEENVYFELNLFENNDKEVSYRVAHLLFHYYLLNKCGWTPNREVVNRNLKVLIVSRAIITWEMSTTFTPVMLIEKKDETLMLPSSIKKIWKELLKEKDKKFSIDRKYHKIIDNWRKQLKKTNIMLNGKLIYEKIKEHAERLIKNSEELYIENETVEARKYEEKGAFFKCFAREINLLIESELCEAEIVEKVKSKLFEITEKEQKSYQEGTQLKGEKIQATLAEWFNLSSNDQDFIKSIFRGWIKIGYKDNPEARIFLYKSLNLLKYTEKEKELIDFRDNIHNDPMNIKLRKDIFDSVPMQLLIYSLFVEKKNNEWKPDIENPVDVSNRYYLHLKELIDNIVKHTTTQKGAFVARVLIIDGFKINENCITSLKDKISSNKLSLIEQPSLKDQKIARKELTEKLKSFQFEDEEIEKVLNHVEKIDESKIISNENEFNNYIQKMKENRVEWILNIIVIDNSKKGIIDTSIEHMKQLDEKRGTNEHKKDLDRLSDPDNIPENLSAFFNTHNISDPKKVSFHQIIRVLACWGLLIFAKLIEKCHGYFEVYSANEIGKAQISKSPDPDLDKENVTTLKNTYKNFNGTTYNIVLPLKKELFPSLKLTSSEHIAVVTPLVNAFHELLQKKKAVLTWEEFKEKNASNIMNLDFCLVDIDDSTVLNKETKEIIQSIANNDKLILAVKYLGTSSFSEFLRRIASLQIELHLTDIVLYNIPDEEIGIFLDFIPSSAFWNDGYYLILYPRDRIAPVILGGKTKQEAKYLNELISKQYGGIHIEWINTLFNGVDSKEPDVIRKNCSFLTLKDGFAMIPYEVLLPAKGLKLFEQIIEKRLAKEIEV